MKNPFYNYKKFIQMLQLCVSQRKKNVKKVLSHIGQNSDIAVRCLCQLLVAHPYFNLSEVIVSAIIPFLNDSRRQVSSLVRSSVEQVFREDMKGEISFLVVKAIYNLVLSKKFKVKPDVVHTFTSLNIRRVDFRDKREKKKKLTYKERKEQLSRKQRKTMKADSKWTADLEHLEQQEDQATRLRLHTKIVEMIFHVFIRVLKRQPDAKILSAVLEGLRHFALLINMDLIPDLLNAFATLLEADKLAPLDSLRVVFTAVSVLSGEGAALSIDPRSIYHYAYKHLRKICSSPQTERNVPLLIDTLHTMLIEHRKDIPHQRVLNFLVRMIEIAVSIKSITISAILLALSAQVFMHFPKAAALLDPEESGPIGCIAAIPSENPDLSLPRQNCLIDLQSLAKSQTPSIRSLATQILNNKFSTSTDPHVVYKAMNAQPSVETDESNATQNELKRKLGKKPSKRAKRKKYAV